MNLNHREAESEGALGKVFRPPCTDDRWKPHRIHDGPRSCKVTQGMELLKFSPPKLT